MRLVSLCFAAFCLVSASLNFQKPAIAEDKAEAKAVVEIIKPKSGDKVDTVEEISIQTAVEGEPLILIRSTEPGSLWWVQQRSKALNPSRFISTARIGNGKTPIGSEFLMTAVLVKEIRDFEKCPPGTPLEEIPESLERSKEIKITLDPPPGKVSKLDVITQPRSDTTVGRTVLVAGRLTTKGWPVVLVRSTEPGSLWWIQNPVQMTDKSHFRVLARIGNTRTQLGSKFEIAFILTDRPEAFKPGQAIPKIPSDITQSPAIQVVFDRAKRR